MLFHYGQLRKVLPKIYRSCLIVIKLYQFTQPTSDLNRFRTKSIQYKWSCSGYSEISLTGFTAAISREQLNWSLYLVCPRFYFTILLETGVNVSIRLNSHTHLCSYVPSKIPFACTNPVYSRLHNLSFSNVYENILSFPMQYTRDVLKTSDSSGIWFGSRQETHLCSLANKVK